MADFTPVGAEIKPPAATSLADMVNMARGIQAYQQAGQINPLLLQQQQYATQASGAQAQGAQMSIDERKAIAPILQNIKSYSDEDGNLDYNRLQTDIMQAAPTTGAEILGKVAETHAAASKAQTAVLGLKQEQRTMAGQFITSLANDDPQTALKKSEAFVQQYPQLKPVMDFNWKYILGPAAKGQSVPGGPNPFSQAALQAGAGTLSVGGQKEAMQPQYHELGGEYRQINPMAAALGAPSVIPKVPSQETVSDVTGQPVTKITDPKTGAISYKPLSDNYPKPMMQYPAGESAATLPEVQKIRSDAINQMPNVKNGQLVNNLIIDAAKKSATGAGANWRAYIGSLPGLKYTFGGDIAADTATLNEYLARETANAATTAGGNPTQAGQAAAAIAGSTDDPALAIQRKAIFNNALYKGAELFANGVDAATRNPNGNGAFEARQFKTDFYKNYSPEAMVLYNAATSPKDKNGKVDPAQTDMVDAVKQSIGFVAGKPLSQQPARVQDLLKQVKNLEKLVSTGKL